MVAPEKYSYHYMGSFCHFMGESSSMAQAHIHGKLADGGTGGTQDANLLLFKGWDKNNAFSGKLVTIRICQGLKNIAHFNTYLHGAFHLPLPMQSAAKTEKFEILGDWLLTLKLIKGSSLNSEFRE